MHCSYVSHPFIYHIHMAHALRYDSTHHQACTHAKYTNAAKMYVIVIIVALDQTTLIHHPNYNLLKVKRINEHN